MPSTIPERDEKALVLLFSLPAQTAEDLARTVEGAPISLHLEQLERIVTGAVRIDPEAVSEIVRLLASFHLLRSQQPNISVQELTDYICRAAEQTGNPKLKVSDAIRSSLLRLLGARSLFVSAKALGIVREQAAAYCAARILTDIRPIFDDAETPAAEVVLHTLRLTYHDSTIGEKREFFIGLGQRDLEDLRDMLDRAIRKESAIKSLAESAHLPVLQLEFHSPK